MSRAPFLFSLFCAFLAVFFPLAPAAGEVPVHPRLFFGPEEIPAMRAKAEKEPWKDILRAIEWASENDRADDYERAIPRPANFAALHLFRGSDGERDYATLALHDVLFLLFAPDREGKPVWGQTSARALSRAGRAKQVALSYDLLYPAWEGRKMPAEFVIRDGRTFAVPTEFVGRPVNEVISQLLKQNADSLVESAGPGWPGDQKLGNNWNAVRFGGAALSYLASNEPREEWQKNFDTAVRRLLDHKRANLSTHPGANGWNPEGIAYAQYPGWTTYPLVLALRRLDDRDLAQDVPALRLELWSTFQGVLPLPRRSRVDSPETGELGLGLRPDFTDDHPVWDGEGTGSLAFAMSPPEYLPGLKWIYRRLVGDLGDRTWDTASGHGLYALLFYPAEIEEKNPAEVWGRVWQDDSFGMFVFRNEFAGPEDIVAQTVAKLRPTFGGHEGRDALSFRLWGLGMPWAVGSGRTSDIRGQTTVFPRDPEEAVTPPAGLVPSVRDRFLRRNGDGFVVMHMEQSDTGVTSHTRRFVTDFSGRSGAPALVVVSDSSEDGRVWRLNTPDFQTITTRENGFTITAPNGARLEATILHPPSGVQPRTGEFQRGSGFAFGEIGLKPEEEFFGSGGYTTQNKWVDFVSEDGEFLVALTLVPAGEEAPTVTARKSDGGFTVQAGEQTIRIEGERIQAEGWTRPALSVESPGDEDFFHQGETDIVVRGRAADPDGIDTVLVRRGDQPPVAAQLQGETWTATLPQVPVGVHEIEVTAVDAVGDSATERFSLRVHSTVPPNVALTSPDRNTTLAPGKSLTIEGRAVDPEGSAVEVEIRAGGEKLAKVQVEDKRFSWTWNEVPPGRHYVTALATDEAGDQSETAAVLVHVPVRFGRGSISDVTDLWVGNFEADPVSPAKPRDRNGFHPTPDSGLRWSVVTEEGETFLRVRPTERWDFANRQLWIPGSEKLKNWRLTWRMRMRSPLENDTSALVLFGTGIAGPLAMDFRPTNSIRRARRDPRGAPGTRLWYLAPNDNRNEIGWTHNPHTPDDPGFPDQPARDFAGIPDDQWHAYRMEREGTKLRVWRNDVLILEADSPWVASPGPVGFANERLVGSSFDITDISLKPLP